VIDAALQQHEPAPVDSLEIVQRADAEARQTARNRIVKVQC
jgi:hypothetical protein